MGTVSILGAMGGLAFGSMERKLAPMRATSVPGPGSYEPPSFAVDDGPSDPDKPRAPRKLMARMPSSAFKSATPKDVVTEKACKYGKEMPPPGAYDPVHSRDASAVVRMPAKGEGFLGGSQRFKYSDKESMGKPGPGSYPAHVTITGGKQHGTFNRTALEGVPKSGRPQGMGFGSQESRMKEKPGAKATPDPGAYSTEPGWMKKTHNVYFGDMG
jgi:hypothetical protein